MDITIMVILVWVAAFIGGLINAFVAWCRQNPPEPFDPRKFGMSAAIAHVLGGGYAAGYNYSTGIPAIFAFIGALIWGAGWVSLGSNVAGAIAARAMRMAGK